MSSTEKRQVPPATPVTALLAFLASHLVILTLIGFLVSGLWLKGLWGLPVGVTATRVMPQVETAIPVAEPAASPAQTVPGHTAQAERPPAIDSQRSPDPAADAGAPSRPAPRLIGGSLPIFGAPAPQQQMPAGVPPATPADTDFRPSALPPGAAPAYEPTRDELVQQARQAFWNGDFEAAEAAYLMVLMHYPGDADAFGELGNLYQAMGKPGQALDAYYEAAVRLKAKGNLAKLRKIITLLNNKGDSRGASLMP